MNPEGERAPNAGRGRGTTPPVQSNKEIIQPFHTSNCLTAFIVLTICLWSWSTLYEQWFIQWEGM